jgi:hypothetical protein
MSPYLYSGFPENDDFVDHIVKNFLSVISVEGMITGSASSQRASKWLGLGNMIFILAVTANRYVSKYDNLKQLCYRS